MAGAGVTATLTEGDGSTFVTYVTGDPHGLLELEGLAIFGVLTIACLAVPAGCALALAWGGYRAAWATAGAAMLLIGALVVVLIASQELEPPVMPWGLLAGSFGAGLAARKLVLALARPRG